MKRPKKWAVYAASIALPIALGGLFGFLTKDGMQAVLSLRQPPLMPPSWLFPAVWVVLYTLMGIGAARVWLAGRDSQTALALYAAQLGFNCLWTIFFFNLQWFAFSFFWLLVLLLLIAAMVRAFNRSAPPAGWRQLPYLAWSAFACYLNGAIWFLNR